MRASGTAASSAAAAVQALALPLAALLVTFALGVGAGFVYAHEPAPAEVRTRLAEGGAPADSSLRGTLTGLGSDYLEVTTAEGTRRLTRAPGVPLEELTPLVGAPAEGVAVNLGGNRTDSGFVITGVVVLDGPAQ